MPLTAMTNFLGHFRNRLSAVIHDLLVIPVAWLGAFWLRFNLGEIPPYYLKSALSALPLVLIVQGLLFWYFGLYRGVWRFASLPDLVRIIKAVAMGGIVVALSLFFVFRMQYLPRSVFPLYGLLLVVLLGGPRLVYRWLKDHKLYSRPGKRVLIVGAGRAGEMLVREMRRDPSHPYDPIGFVDDGRRKQGKEIQSVPVIGKFDEIPLLSEAYDVELIIIAIPSAKAGQIQRVVELCESTGVAFRTIPAMDAVMSGTAVLHKVRNVSIEDLLGREPVSLNWTAIQQSLLDKCVLVTGGGGSIGAELCRQIAQLMPGRLIVADQNEHNLFTIDNQLRQLVPTLEVHCRLLDVTDASAVDHLMSLYRPHIVFHAAAYKHVPMLEGQIREAIHNNSLGTKLMADAADRHACESFVFISTDKAVNPANIMGATKRIAEIYCQNLNRQSETHFITVRFGNVLGSAGSVVPLFRQQIEAGGPVTVTHPKMTRYFMTIPEACQLIMQSAAMGRGGEIFVLDMGVPVSITYLAEQMIKLSGHEPGRDIQIVYTGLRPGEKLFEELFHETEHLSSTPHDKILLAEHRPVDWQLLETLFKEIEIYAEKFDEEGLRTLMLKLVPELHRIREELPDNVIPFGQRQKA
jgi:FlaA1/EpsC-like NDP-sugar epimerase